MNFSALLISTDIPDISCDQFVKIRFANGNINFYWDNNNTISELLSGFNSNSIDLNKDDIQRVQITLKPDIPDNFEYSPWNQPDYTKITFRHNDPNEVVPFFTTVIGVEKQYWALSLKKHLTDNSSILVLIGEPSNMIVDYTELQDAKKIDTSKFESIVFEIEQTINGGGQVTIEQSYSNSSPDIVATIKSLRGLQEWRQYLNF